MGADSGHGESTDEDKNETSSGSEDDSSQLVDREALKWKRGRLLGKGAYGKVWEGLLDSAKMIAVKEVELDMESQERAQSVSHVMSCNVMCVSVCMSCDPCV